MRLENLLGTATCFTYPRTAVFSLVFISPTIFHHILLVMTLFKSWQFLQRSGQSLTINPLLAVIRRDHILFVLAICLINFSNLVLSLQPGDFPYKLVGALTSPVAPALTSCSISGQSASRGSFHADLPGQDRVQPEEHCPGLSVERWQRKWKRKPLWPCE